MHHTPVINSSLTYKIVLTLSRKTFNLNDNIANQANHQLIRNLKNTSADSVTKRIM